MNFIKELKETDDTKTLMKVMPFDEDMTFRMLKGIKINDDLWMSIQASYGHYCSPRKTLKSLDDYACMEFALMNKEGSFVSVDEVLPNFSKAFEIRDYFEGSVYAYVPVELIDDLFNELNA